MLCSSFLKEGIWRIGGQNVKPVFVFCPVCDLSQWWDLLAVVTIAHWHWNSVQARLHARCTTYITHLILTGPLEIVTTINTDLWISQQSCSKPHSRAMTLNLPASGAINASLGFPSLLVRHNEGARLSMVFPSSAYATTSCSDWVEPELCLPLSPGTSHILDLGFPIRSGNPSGSARDFVALQFSLYI